MQTTELVMFQKTIKYNRDNIWLKPLCDFFDISYKWQVEVVKKDHILTTMVRKNSSETTFGDKRGRILLPKKGFIRWIQLINPAIIREDLQDSFKNFQTLVFDYLYGSAEEKELIRHEYNRLHKLKKLYSKLGNEIKQSEKSLNFMLNNHYNQLRLPYESQEEIAEENE